MSTYPQRLSTDELRAELDTYIALRRQHMKKEPTLQLDRLKVEQFLRWRDTGELPGQPKVNVDDLVAQYM